MAVRFAFDLGVQSLGSAVLKLGDRDKRKNHLSLMSALPEVLHSNVVLSPDFGARAQERAGYRRAAKTKHHKEQRLNKLRNLLVRNDFYPVNQMGVDELHSSEHVIPVEVIVLGYDQIVPRHHLGAALLWAAKSRGQRSAANVQYIEQEEDDESGLWQSAISSTMNLMSKTGMRTIHEFMARRPDLGDQYKGQAKPNKIVLTKDSKGVTSIPFGYNQIMVQDSLAKFLTKQQESYPEINEAFVERIIDLAVSRNIASKYSAGYCRYDNRRDENRERRLRRDHPLAFRLRAYQFASHANVFGREVAALTPEQRDAVVDYLSTTTRPVLNAIKSLLGLSARERFVFRDADKQTDTVLPRHTLAIACQDAIGSRWDKLSFEQQCSLTEPMAIRSHDDRHSAIETLQLPLTSAEIQQLSVIPQLNNGYMAGGITATSRIVDQLSNPEEVINLHDAVLRAGYDHDNGLSPERLNSLPYYGEVLTDLIHNQDYSANPIKETEKHFGRITNPVVHGQLNALRREYNRLVSIYGRPHDVVVELTRDLRNRRTVEEAETQKKKGDKHRQAFNDLMGKLKCPKDETNYKKYKIASYARKFGFESTGKQQAKAEMVCVGCGKAIPDTKLFEPHGIEFCHIFPESVSGDNSIGNLFLGCRDCNVAMGANPPQRVVVWGDKYTEILERVSAYYPINVARRFAPNAWDRYLQAHGGFIERNLTDTSYVAKAAVKYIQSQFAKDQRSSRVKVTRGIATGLLRRRWRLEEWLDFDREKESKRDDNRHHALDAIVIGLTSKPMIELVRIATEQRETANIRTRERRARIMNYLPELPVDYLDRTRAVFEQTRIDETRKYPRFLRNGIPVSTGIKGSLSAATLYSPNRPADRDGNIIPVMKPLKAPTKGNPNPAIEYYPVDDTPKEAVLVRQKIDLLRDNFQPKVPINPDLIYDAGKGGVSRAGGRQHQMLVSARNRFADENKKYHVILLEEAKRFNVRFLYYFESGIGKDAKKLSGMVEFEERPSITRRSRDCRNDFTPKSKRLQEVGGTAYAVVFETDRIMAKNKVKRVVTFKTISLLDFTKPDFSEGLKDTDVVLHRFQKGDIVTTESKGIKYEGMLTSISKKGQVEWHDLIHAREIKYHPYVNGLKPK